MPVRSAGAAVGMNWKGGEDVQGFDSVLKNASVAVNLYNKSSYDWNNMAKLLEDKGFRPSIRIAQNASAQAEKFYNRMITYTNFELSAKIRMLTHILQVLKDILEEVRKRREKAAGSIVNIVYKNSHQVQANKVTHSVYNSIRTYSYASNTWIEYDGGGEVKKKKNPILDFIIEFLNRLKENLMDRVINGILDKFLKKKGENASGLTINVNCKCVDGLSSRINLLYRIISLISSLNKLFGKSPKEDIPSVDTKTKGSNGLKSVYDSIKDTITAVRTVNALKAIKGFAGGSVASSGSKLLGIISKTKGITKKIPVIGIASTIYDIATAKDKKRAVITNAGGWAGAAAGASAGAALGTLVFPGIGTAIGGAVGGILGSIGVEKATGYIYDNFNKIKSTVSNAFNKTTQLDKSFLGIGTGNLDKPSKEYKGANTAYNTFNITVSGINKTTDQIMSELVAKIKEAANIMGEAVVN